MDIKNKNLNSKNLCNKDGSKNTLLRTDQNNTKDTNARKFCINVIDLDKELGSHSFVNGD